MFLTPGEDVPQSPDDKLVHLLTFVALAVAGRWAGVPWVALGVGLAVYAGVTEILQAVLPIHRNGDVRDLLADVTGVALGLFLSWIAVRVGRARGV
jgi:VanZ family protein